jgi:hypothetical protein
MNKDGFTILLILILAVAAVGVWWFMSDRQQPKAFSTEELSAKIVYTLVDGTVTDVKLDCAKRGGYFNSCGSLCEAGVPCALVCAYTCEFEETLVDPNTSGPVDLAADAEIECGVTKDFATVQCPVGETCFTYSGSAPTCSTNPCAGCQAGQECLQLESYPVQIRCLAKDESEQQETGAGEVPDEEVEQSPRAVEPVAQAVTENENIKVTSLTPKQTVTSPLTIAGEVNPALLNIYFRITNDSGTTLINEAAEVHRSDFSIKISYQFSATKSGFVEVYSLNSQNQEENLIRIPVEFN